MTLRTLFCAAGALVLVTPAFAGIENTLEFEDLTSGDMFNTGSMFSTEGVTVSLNEFFFFPGPGGTANGFAEVINPNQAGAGNGIFANNTNLDFGFAFPQTTIGFAYANEGGNVNLTINNTLLNAGELIDLNGMMVGDVTVTVSPDMPGIDTGFVTLVGTIDQFSVGGQEFNLDDVRYTVPSPGALMLGAITLVGLRRRR